MNSKINTIKSYLKNTSDRRINSLKYKIIIIKNSYFFVVHKGYEEKFYTSGHKDIKGWYSGILSFSKTDVDIFHIFISDIYYNHLSTEDLFLKIIYQIIMYLNLDFLKLKYKKSRKHLHNYLKENLPKNIKVDDPTIDNLLSSKEDQTLFQKIVAGSALDDGVDAQILEHLEQSPDHPISLSFPESAYLKGLVLRVQS